MNPTYHRFRNMMTDSNSMPNSQETTGVPENQSVSKFTVIDIGSGVSVCDLPYDGSKYERLVEEFRKKRT